MKRIPCSMAMVWILLASPIFATSPNNESAAFAVANHPVSDAEIGCRMQGMECAVRPALDEDVRAYLNRYFTYGREDAKAMLGRSIVYLPTVEHYLRLHAMPASLKYLPMIESEMLPFAVSTKGAAGLWQLVSETGSSLGLIIDEHLDERKDPARSSDAAVKYLKRLKERYGDWELALVAYNCGPGRLNRAMQKAGSKDYNQLKKYLPLETQRYLARYMAAAYLGQFAELHGIVPSLPDGIQLSAVSARVYGSISLQTMSKLTGVDIVTLRRLNPSYLKDVIPARNHGTFLTLPRPAWQFYLDSLKKSVPRP